MARQCAKRRPMADLGHAPHQLHAGHDRAPLSAITGGAGFIGRHLAHLLVDHGHRVRVIDLVEPFELDAAIEAVRGSILDRALLRRAFAGAEYVFHLAANPNLWARDKGTFHITNYEGTKTVLEEAARAEPRRIVYCSTESILK